MLSVEQMRITWNIHWSCNYRCSYCFFDKEWVEKSARNEYRSAAEWLARWTAVRDRYGRCFVTINGGEPFAYPGFLDILSGLSALHWPINVTTNASMNLEEYARRINHERVSLSLSYHPQFETLGGFIEKVTFLRKAGVQIGCLNFVGYPPFLKELPETVKRLADMGESLKTIPFVGSFRSVHYPDGYNAEERALLGMDDAWIDGKRPKGMLCRAGHRSALLLPDGNVTRCGQIGDPGIFGSFFDEGFSFLPEPSPCAAEFCPCDEWKVIPDEKAPAKAGAWLP